MKKNIILACVVICVLGSLTSVTAAGGMEPCLATCCLDWRLGYEMNEGKTIHMYDWLTLAGRISQVPLWIIPAYEWGYRESGAAGCCVSILWGARAGRDFKSLRLRSKEILLCVPIINIYPIIMIPMEAMDGKTWSQVLEEENLQR